MTKTRPRSCSDTIAEAIAITTEPQWIGAYGALRAELHARRGELDDARRYVEQGLGRIEVCTDDAIRIARLSASAVAVEADRAQRARDLRDTAGRRDALARARLHMDRLEAAVAAGGAVEQARLAEAKAEMARARGRGSAREWAKAADAWESIGRPYKVAQARWREAECEIAAGKRERAAQAPPRRPGRSRAARVTLAGRRGPGPDRTGRGWPPARGGRRRQRQRDRARPDPRRRRGSVRVDAA